MAKRARDPRRLELLQGTLDLLVLQTLRWGPQHGYGIAVAIQAGSGDVLRVDTGSLYPALHRLEQQGWIKAKWDEGETGRTVKFYSLTRAGQTQLEKEVANWSRLSTAVSQVVLASRVPEEA